jgi:hypothetical protein
MAPKFTVSAKQLVDTTALTTISGPAWIALFSYLVLGAIILFPFKYSTTDPDTGRVVDVTEYDFGARIIAILLLAFPVALSVYSINCLVIGSCYLYSYIVAGLTAVWVTLFVISAFAFTFFNHRM